MSSKIYLFFYIFPNYSICLKCLIDDKSNFKFNRYKFIKVNGCSNIFNFNISVGYMLYKIYVSKFQSSKELPGFNKILAIFSNNDLYNATGQV